MNLDSFYTYINNPALLNNNSVTELSEIIERYPYFQTARLLYLKNLQLLNDYRFNDELKIVSAYAVNREVLYKLVSEKIEKQSVKENNNNFKNIGLIEKPEIVNFESQLIETEVVSEIKNIENKKIIKIIDEEKEPEQEALPIETPKISFENNKQEELHIKSESISEVISDSSNKIESTELAENLPKQVSKEEVNIKIEEVIKVSETQTIIESEKEKIKQTSGVESIADIIIRKAAEIKAQRNQRNQQTENQIKTIEEPKQIPEIILSQQKIEVLHEVIVEPDEKLIQNEEKVKSEVMVEQHEQATNKIIESTIELDTEKILNLEHFKISESEEIKLAETPSYDINQLSVIQPDENKSDKPETQGRIEFSNEKMSFENWINFISNKSQNINKQKTQEKIIENFIISEPEIQINIQPENNNVDSKIKNNSDMEIDLISESLADIYAKQGLFKKAMIMFEKLALKYPEKNIYFANRISEIKKDINNQ